MASEGRHTILLVQHTDARSSRTYYDYPSINAAMDGVVSLYEARLRELNPDYAGDITYEITDLFAWIDSLGDLAALAFHGETGMYEPCGKEWIKGRCFESLKRAAGRT